MRVALIYRVIPGRRTFERIMMITVAIVPNNAAIRRFGVIAALLEKKGRHGFFFYWRFLVESFYEVLDIH